MRSESLGKAKERNKKVQVEWKKMRMNQSGLTILELLLAVLILGMVISLTAAGSGIARQYYADMRDTYDARVTADEILEEMERWIRFSENPVVEEEEIRYYDSVKKEMKVLCLERWRELPYGLTLSRISDEQPVFAWDEEGESVLISFVLCDSTGAVRAKVYHEAVRILNSLEKFHENRIDL